LIHGSVITYVIESCSSQAAIAPGEREPNHRERAPMSGIAEFPLPADATAEERAVATREIAAGVVRLRCCRGRATLDGARA